MNNPLYNQVRQATTRPRAPRREPIVESANFTVAKSAVIVPVLREACAGLTTALGGEAAVIRQAPALVRLECPTDLGSDDLWSVSFARIKQDVRCRAVTRGSTVENKVALAQIDQAWVRARVEEWIGLIWPPGARPVEHQPVAAFQDRPRTGALGIGRGKRGMLGLLALICLICGCATPVTHGIPNLALVDAQRNIWRGGQPTAEGWAFLAANGVTNSVKLNTGTDQIDPRYGITVLPRPMSTWRQIFGPVKEQVEGAIEHDHRTGTIGPVRAP